MKKTLTPEDFGASTAEALIDADTLSGDLRDAMLTHIRSMTVPWAMLNEQEQGDKIYAVSQGCNDVVRRACAEIAHRGFPNVQVTLGATKIDKGLEIKLGATGSVDNITRLAEHGKGSAVLVLAEAAEFFGERAAAKPEKDQPDLPIAAE